MDSIYALLLRLHRLRYDENPHGLAEHFLHGGWSIVLNASGMVKTIDDYMIRPGHIGVFFGGVHVGDLSPTGGAVAGRPVVGAVGFEEALRVAIASSL